jgi:hypothetical protein
MAGFEPAPQGLEGPQATVTPHSLWTGVAHRPIDVRRLSKTPLLRAWWLETRMLPLHHAIVVAHDLTAFSDKTSPRPDAGFFRASGQNKKGLLGDRPRRPGSR